MVELLEIEKSIGKSKKIIYSSISQMQKQEDLIIHKEI